MSWRFWVMRTVMSERMCRGFASWLRGGSGV